MSNRSDLSFEPMDIDLSSQSVKVMDISDIDTHDGVTENPIINSVYSSDPYYSRKSSPGKESTVKKFHINMQRSSRNSNNTLLKIIFVITGLISIVTYQLCSIKCSEQLNLDTLKETLSTRLYGQRAAIDILVKTLDLKARSKILFFCGGTGVGKTLTSSVLLETVDPGSNVYHYMMPTFRNTMSTQLMYGLIMCKMSLFIIDDLTINDMDIKEQIKSLIEKSESLGKEITVILIFHYDERCGTFEERCVESMKSNLLDNFSEIKALKSYIQFKPLSEIHLMKCIQQELGDRQLSDIEFNNVLKNFNVSVDGCKGVHSKMKYLIPM